MNTEEPEHFTNAVAVKKYHESLRGPHTCFLDEHCVNGQWERRHYFYCGLMDRPTDQWLADSSRHKEVPGKRKQSIYVGTIIDLEFPVKYPIQLDDGMLVNDPRLEVGI